MTEKERNDIREYQREWRKEHISKIGICKFCKVWFNRLYFRLGTFFILDTEFCPQCKEEGRDMIEAMLGRGRG